MTEEVPTSVLELINCGRPYTSCPMHNIHIYYIPLFRKFSIAWLTQNYLIKHQNNFIDLQTKFIEEKEKNFNFEKKIHENELKEMKEKIQKLKSDHKNEIEELKQNYKQAVILATENENISLNQVNNQKDEKINSLEKQIKEINNLFEQKIADLSIKLERVNYLTCKVVMNQLVTVLREMDLLI
uniref:Uncharacterized protein n=1 Tax=Meloidogyne incognita TaxID=6306 RepID=A0A914LGL1_MELIC